MVRRAVSLAALAVVVAAAPAFAQSPKVEVSGIFGWTFSDGVTGDPILAGDGNIYDAIDAADSFNWGFMIGVNATDNMEVGFLFGQQQSTLEISGTATREIGDLNVNSYHGYFAYNFGPPDAPIRPYVLGGIGATNYGGVDFTVGGVSGTTDSSTRFSTTNCPTSVREEAPKALRTPISEARSTMRLVFRLIRFTAGSSMKRDAPMTSTSCRR